MSLSRFLFVPNLGNFAITTVGKINNMDELIAHSFKNGSTHFLEMSGGSVNPTEMVASLINQKGNMIEGIRYAQDMIEGSMTMLILTPKGLIAARDKLGRTPLIIGQKEDACCVSFESFAYVNLGYEDVKELGPGENCGSDAGRCGNSSETGRENAYLFFLMGILWIPDLYI